MAENRILTNEEALAILNAKAKERGDTFRVKAFRKGGPGQLQAGVATLDEATVAHFANPEMWLPKIAGGSGGQGSMFLLSAYHTDDLTTALVQGMQFQIPGEPKRNSEGRPTLDFDAPRSHNWQGPGKIIWPEPENKNQGETVFSLPQVPSPGIDARGLSAANVRASGPDVPGMVSSNAHDLAFGRLEAERAQVVAMRRELDEQRHKMEMDLIRREADARFNALEAKLAQPPAKAGGGIAEVVTVIAPLVMQMMQAQDAMRLEMFKAQQASQAAQQTLLTSVLERKTDDSPNMKMMSTVSESMGVAFKLATDSMKQAAEALNGPTDPPGLLVVKELVKGVNAVASGLSSRPTKVKLPQQQQRPPMMADPRLPGSIPQAGPPRPTHVQAVPNPVPPPMQKIPVPAPIEDAVIVPETPALAEPAARLTSVDRIDAMIRSMVDVDAVASEFVAAIEDPDMMEALLEADGDPVQLFKDRFDEWVNEDLAERGPYVKDLSIEIDTQLRDAGWVEDPAGQEVTA